MRKPEQTTEPSIEEILASIRRIIADDGAAASGSAFESGGPETGREQAEARYVGVQQDDFWQEEEFDGHHPQRSAPADDEILELTEDYMVREAAAAAARQTADQLADERTDVHGAFAMRAAEYGSGYQDYAEEEHAPFPRPAGEDLDAPGMVAMEAPLTSEGLDSVLSNVVAEMHRLSEGQGLDAAKGFDPYDEMEEAPEPEPDFEPEAEPAAWHPPSRPAQAGPQQRPVWSARRLAEEDTSGRNAQAPEPVSRDPVPRQAADTLEDLAAAMPEAGLGAPFFEPPGEMPEPVTAARSTASEEARPSDAQAAQGAAEAPPIDLDDQRRAVGDTLSRAFAGAAEPEETDHPGDARDLQAKAAELAKTAVSDFATEKLSAPPVAHALRADKPFMAEITNSVAGALARKAAQKGESEPAEVELPEGALAADLDATPAADAPAQTTATAELPRDHARDMQAASDTATPSAAPATAKEERVPPDSSVHEEEDTAPAGLPDGLETAVVEMLKPLIVKWLDNNLPRLVEKALREEVAENGTFLKRGGRTNGAGS